MTFNIVRKIDDQVKIQHVLISVSDKKNLDLLVPRLMEINPGIKIFSTGGTFNHLKKILGPGFQTSLIQVAKYTGQPETQGGLVKTLDFKIYLGLLTETYNKAHQNDLQRTKSVPIDMVVVNLYPFEKTISDSAVTVETARGNIDIGGPCMIRAAAKNFIRAASVTNPDDYDMILSQLTESGGKTSLKLRFQLAKKAFEHTATYDRRIADFLAEKTFNEVSADYF